MTGEDMDYGAFFDHIDDFLDFPSDHDDEAAEAEAEAETAAPVPILDSFPEVWSESSSSFPCSYDISPQLSLPYDDIVQMEWLSSFVDDDSFSGSCLPLHNPSVSDEPPNKQLRPYRLSRTPSPVSVLDSSSSSCSADKSSDPIVPSPCGRARTKRSRPTSINFRPINATPLPPSVVSPAPESNSAESHLAVDKKKKKKKKKIRFTLPAPPLATNGDINTSTLLPVRKCQHCEITKTPQWRAGPMGPKTLCNACGVRYKSGRLFPEYRPAASPTFVPSVHSNSHKKVLEMRNKVGGKAGNPRAAAAEYAPPSLAA